MKLSCIICGFGNVGTALAVLLEERRDLLLHEYGIEIVCRAVIASKGAAVSADGLPLQELAGYVRGGNRLDSYSGFGRTEYVLQDAVSSFEPGIIFEVTPTDIKSGEPGLSHFKSGIEYGWNIASANKGPLVIHMKELKKSARKAGVKIKFSAATAAALPATDVGLTCLAGSSISKIEGIVTGTTNLLLTRMAETGQSYHDALIEAQEKGLAETDPGLDVEGWDTANKTLILANTLMDADLSLTDMEVEGITGLDPVYVRETHQKGKSIKLLGTAEKKGNSVSAFVRPVIVDKEHPLYAVNGTEKGITFSTDTMGKITVTGGRAGPVGTSAALLKDLINIYRKN